VAMKLLFTAHDKQLNSKKFNSMKAFCVTNCKDLFFNNDLQLEVSFLFN